jgi:transposase-like protein
MKKKHKKWTRPYVLSHDPYKRRGESEIMKIVCDIQSGVLGIRASCRKYGICRTTLQKWIRRLSLRTLGNETSNQLLVTMSDNQERKAFEQKIKELTNALELERLKNDGLKIMIKVAEEDLHIKIRKKPGTKQSKE